MNNPGDAPTAEEGGGSNNYAFADKNGAYFGGIIAENFVRGLETQMNNPDINGNWIFMAATNKNGDWGYWALTPIEGLEAGNGMLSEVKFRNDFFSFDDEDEHPHPKKSTNRPTGNLLLDAALTMNQASHFQGDLFGFWRWPIVVKGPF